MASTKKVPRNSPYRAVVVGCGHIGSLFSGENPSSDRILSHAHAYREHPETELAGVIDLNAGLLAKAQKAWGVPGGRDAIAFCLEHRPEIISLCTPDPTHAPLALKLLEKCPPKMLVIEKPLALSSRDAQKILNLARRKKVAVAVNYSRRYLPTFRALAEEIRSGKHGKPILFRMVYGKGLFHNGSHAVDLMRMLAGEPNSGRSYSAFPGLLKDDSRMADLRLKNGCFVRLDAFPEKIATVFELDFLLEKSRIQFLLGGQEWRFSEVRENQRTPGYFNFSASEREKSDPLFAQPHRGALWYLVENLVAHLDHGAALLCSSEEALKTLKVVEKLKKTSR